MNEFLSIGIYSSDSGPYLKSHKHYFWELIYYTEGNGVNHIGGQDIPFEKGCLICQPPGIFHHEISKEGFKNIFLMIREMDNFDMDIPVFYDSEYGELEQLLTQMFFCYHSRGNNRNSILKSTLVLLNEYLISRQAQRRKNRYVEFCEHTIIENISNHQFSLPKTLDSIPMSNTYFMKLFKKEIGYTPNTYLQMKRVEYAKQLMGGGRMGNLLIKDIARMCGFNDQYYFSKIFKKQTGVSPKLYLHDQ